MDHRETTSARAEGCDLEAALAAGALFDALVGGCGQGGDGVVDAELLLGPEAKIEAVIPEGTWLLERALGEGGLGRWLPFAQTGLETGDRLAPGQALVRRGGGGWYDLAAEWVAEAIDDRRGPAYGRWVQAALNQVAAAGLQVDGILGPRSRQAVQSFQRQHGLAPDGIVGPRTEQALVAAGAPPPSPGGAFSPPPGFGPPPALVPPGVPPALLPAACQGPPTVLARFVRGSAALTPEHHGAVAGLAARIASSQSSPRPLHLVCLVGHTDASGDDAYNQRLGEERAEAVRQALAAQLEALQPSLATAAVTYHLVSLGEQAPVASNATADGQAQNRRVEVFLGAVAGEAPFDPTLSAAEEDRVRREQAIGRTPLGPELVEHSGNADADLDLITEGVLCSRSSFVLDSPRGGFCAFPGAVRGTPEHTAMRPRVAAVLAETPQLAAADKAELERRTSQGFADAAASQPLSGARPRDVDALTAQLAPQLTPGQPGQAAFRTRVEAIYDFVLRDRLERIERREVARLQDAAAGTTADYNLFGPRGSVRRGAYSPFVIADPLRSNAADRATFRAQHDVVVLAMNLLLESGPDLAVVGLDAPRAVAHVTQNLMAAGRSLKDVVLTGNTFSWTLHQNERQRALRPVADRLLDSGLRWRQCVEVVFEALAGTMPVPPQVVGATNYLNPAAVPRPPAFENARCYLGQVGCHCFYFSQAGGCPAGFGGGRPRDGFCARQPGAQPRCQAGRP